MSKSVKEVLLDTASGEEVIEYLKANEPGWGKSKDDVFGRTPSKRWISKTYTKWVCSLPCANCRADDGTTMAHHLSHRHAPHNGGGQDYLTMPLCLNCHEAARNGNADLLDFQAIFIFNTLRRAFNYGILGVCEPRDKIGEDKDD